MKTIALSLIFVFCLGQAFADRVCLEKSTGEIITYQTGSVNDPIDISGVAEKDKEKFIAEIKNSRMSSVKGYCISQGYDEEDFECMDISVQELNNIVQDNFKKIKETEKVKAQSEEAKRRSQENKIKEKLGLSDEDFQALKEALR